MTVGLDHVQVAIARSGEDPARSLYSGLLSITEVPNRRPSLRGAAADSPGTRGDGELQASAGSTQPTRSATGSSSSKRDYPGPTEWSNSPV